MKWLLIFLVIAPLGVIQGDEAVYSNVVATDGHQQHNTHHSHSSTLQQQQQPAASNAVYYYQAQPQTNNNPSQGYYNYNNYPGAYHQKQDLFGDSLGGLGNFGLQQGGDGDGGDIGSSIGGIVGAIAALLGLKGLTKLGAAALFIFIFVIIPILIVPLVLSIVAIALAATETNGSGGMIGNLMKNAMGMLQKDNVRSLSSSFESFLKSEDCIERIACSVGRSAFQRNYVLRGTKNNGRAEPSMSAAKNKEGGKSGILARAARGFNAESCETFKCAAVTQLS